MEKLSSTRVLKAQSAKRMISIRHQQGAALLLALLLVVIVGLSIFVAQLSPAAAKFAIEQRTQAALAQAKEALIGRAAADNNRPGSLPCPDTDNDGFENGVAGNCTAYIGRLPYKTLRLDALRDGNGELLWYAMSSALRDNTAAQPINTLTVTGLSLDAQANMAAILFAPGQPLSGQNGRPGNNRSDYLDGTNAITANAFVSGPQSDTFNDSVLGIGRDELFRTVAKRVLAEIGGPDVSGAPANSPPDFGLRRYHADNGNIFPDADTDNDGWSNPGAMTGKLPWRNMTLPATPTPPPASPLNPSVFEATAEGWLTANGWLPLVNYSILTVPTYQATLTLNGVSITVKPCAPLPLSQPCPQ
ncbi:MAG: hypothetical protein H6943_10540 [Zoogloeaceae bacterium]|nr:hypothetical protein [Zoogloeaceae bacterium]